MPHFRPEHGIGLPLESSQMRSLLGSAKPASYGANTMGMDVMFGWNRTTDFASFDMVERSGACDGIHGTISNGLIAGTRVASSLGWRPVEALAPGDLVLTFDNGMQKVTDVKRTSFVVNSAGDADRNVPVLVPAGALGNTDDIKLLPEQGVLVESDAAMDEHGDPFAVITASALAGYRGIRRATHTYAVDVVQVFFEDPQVIYVNGGLLVHCPQASMALTDMLDYDGVAYDVLEGSDAKFLVECMQYEDDTRSYAA